MDEEEGICPDCGEPMEYSHDCPYCGKTHLTCNECGTTAKMTEE